MDQKQLLTKIKKFKNALARHGVRAKKILLFGSWARNTQREDSDIDLIVISQDFKGKGYWKRIDLLSQAVYDVFMPIEAIALTPEEWEKDETWIGSYAKKEKFITV
jgi:predicted nucleotidyltransferase